MTAAHTQPPRFIVIQAESLQGVELPWIPVGVLGWEGVVPQLSILVKVTFTWSGQATAQGSTELPARLSPVQEPVCRAQPHPYAGASPGELYYASDFVPRKRGADVLLVGHARSASPSLRMTGHFAAAGVFRPFMAASSAPAVAIPLTTAYLQPDGGCHGQPLGPIAAPAHPDPSHGEDFDFGHYNAAPEYQRTERIAPDTMIDLAGFYRDGQRRIIRLHGISPLVTLDTTYSTDTPVDLACDTLWVDADREIAVLVWRGGIEVLDNGGEIDRIVLSLIHPGQEVDRQARMSSLMRGRLGFAVREDDPPEAYRALTEDDEERLATARYGTWGADAPPSRLTLLQYAAISAELAEWPLERNQTLARHDLDEDGWAIEERGWLETMAKAAMNGDARLADRYGELFIKAQDGLASPAEKAQTLAAYARIHAAMDATMEPGAVLSEHKLTLAQWLRMQRRWARAAQEDPRIAAELERLVAAAATSQAAAAEPRP